MKYPNIIHMSDKWLQDIRNTSCEPVPNEGWVPARPLGFASFRSRLRAAWLVFTGRADALVWPKQ